MKNRQDVNKVYNSILYNNSKQAIIRCAILTLSSPNFTAEEKQEAREFFRGQTVAEFTNGQSFALRLDKSSSAVLSLQEQEV